MNQREFVTTLVTRVMLSASRGTVDQLLSPSGRSPPRHLTALAVWYNQLSRPDKAAVDEVVKRCAYAATFHFLCVLDGVAAVTEGGGQFQLNYASRDGQVQLVPGVDYLHDLFSEIAPRELA
jgi:hypothetical protein